LSKSKKISISISPETEELVIERAKKLGITKTEYIKHALLEKLKEEPNK